MEKRKFINLTEVCLTLDQLGLRTHYLATKAVGEWDGYDLANYRSLRRKAGKTELVQVFAIYTSDVKEEDRYLVTTMPTSFFDTKQEAEEEIERCYEQGFNNWGSLKVMSLWTIEQ